MDMRFAYRAAQIMLDEEHLPHDDIDSSQYTLGRIGSHNIVLACLPAGQMGIGAAAFTAGQMMSKFNSIRFGLMVGVGGGVPSAEVDVRLGDVVVSHPVKQHGGVVQYDFGKTRKCGRMTRTGLLNAPPKILLNAVTRLRAFRYQDRDSFTAHLPTFDGNPRFNRMNAGPDMLFEAAYTHNGGAACNQCTLERAKHRPAGRAGEEVAIHYGTIASGNQVMRDGVTRDRVSKELGGVLCFEMEAAGLMNDFPCLVVRGISNYADSHKNKTWQPYAAATAAACAKAILSLLPTIKIIETEETRAPGTSSKQTGDFTSVLDDIREQVAQLPNQYSQHTHSPQSGYILDEDMNANQNSTLMESIERLQSNVDREGTVNSEEAESLIDNLECIIHSASTH